MSKLDEINEVVESLFRSGTRYRSQKMFVVSMYLAIVGLSIAWAAIGIWQARGLEAVFESKEIQNLDEKTFALDNVGTLDWHDVRIALDHRYLARVDVLESGSEKALDPSDFKYYYHVPRPWGTADWERLADTSKPSSHAPSDIQLDGQNVEIYSREGAIDVTVRRK